MRFHYSLGSWVLAAVMLSSAGMAQTGGKGGGTRAPSVTQPSGQPSIQTPDGFNRALTLSGNVVVEDGSPLPEPASIERVCNGHVVRQGRTDFKGYFSVTMGQYVGGDSAEDSSGLGFSSVSSAYPGMLQSASTTTRRLMGCELRASLAGFRSSSVMIPMEDLGSGIGIVRVGTIVLQRMGQAQGATVSATNLSAPKDARKAYDKGHRALQNNKQPEAQQALEQAVHEYPQYAAAWQDLGWLYNQQGQLDKAHEAFTQARTADGMFVPAYVGLASVAIRQSKWAEAAETSAQAAQLDGISFPAAFFYNSLANYQLGNLEQAEKSARKAEMLGAQRAFPQLNLLLGMMLAKRHEYADAADRLRAYLKAAPTAANADKVRQHLAEVEKLGETGEKAEAAPSAK